MNKPKTPAARPTPALDLPPSYFSAQGITSCSTWGKSELETFAWIYITGMARDGDTWHEVTPARCRELLTEDECRDVSPWIDPAYDDHRAWSIVRDKIRSAQDAFAIGGFAWARWRYDELHPA